ncbi:uncharacterized protein LOC122393552 [Amphibalanus amphitrite]|uniref:uncharacterized protein LOC122393552 n=1 Tax=Amphibalanus amphitrite TaxID=1232801 RepID=UPI001C9227B0|nr:uncharacterized protein LOC122393552 [Amphibalanus amphitrite]
MLLRTCIGVLIVGCIAADTQNSTETSSGNGTETSHRSGRYLFQYLHNWLGLTAATTTSRPIVKCQGAGCGGGEISVIPVVYVPAKTKECDYSRPCASGHCLSGKCVACSSSVHCGAGLVCSNYKCVPCSNDHQCAGTSVCEHHRCVQCRSQGDCPYGQTCLQNKCRTVV